jgi:SNF2 family DNA or RNA helicase
MDSAWRNDLFRFAMHRRVDVAYGKPEKRKEIIRGDAEFVIINFDGVEIVADAVAQGGFDLIVIDEANAYKNPQTKRWKILSKLLQPTSWLWMLTGTPASQSPLDAYGLAKLVNPSAAPRSFSMYRDQVMNKITQFKWAPKREAEQIVSTLLQPAIRFTKEQCLDLPDLLYAEREVPMTAQQIRYYEKLRKVMAMQAAGEEVTAINAAAKLNKLLQISCGAVYSDSGEIVTFDSSSRTAVLKEVIDESSHKVLVFAPYRHAIEILYEELRKDGYTVDVIHGGVPAGRRTEIFRKFQDEKDPQVLVIQPQAASHGVTLHAANTIVWWAPITSYETYAQANARIHRAGQVNKCLVVKLQGSPVEAKLYKALETKELAQFNLMELYKEEFDLNK